MALLGSGGVTQSASEYQFSEVLLNSDRKMKSGGKLGITYPVNLAAMTGEINFFEDIMKGYVTAKIVVLDDLALLTELVELQGTETIKITIEGVEEQAKRNSFTMEMKVVSVVKQVKTQDRASVFVINAISKHAYADAAVKVSRSYTGQLEDIAEKVLDTYLDVEVDRDKDYFAKEEESVQGRVKVVLPYISPLESVEWLMERATGTEGSPYFAWQTIWDQKKSGKDVMRFGTFKTMLVQGIKEAAANPERKFVYSIGAVAKEPSAEATRNLIVEFSQDNRENTLSMINQGTVGSNISNLDTYTTQKMDRHFSLEDYLDQLKSAVGAGAKNLLGTAYDDKHKIVIEDQKKTVASFDARYRNLVTSYGTYEWENSYHDVYDQSLLVNKVKKSAVVSMIQKNLIDVTLSGYNVFDQELSVGDVILLLFDSQNTEDEGALLGKKDERTSGFYLILNSRNIFNGNKHRTIVTGAKVADLP